MNFVQAAAAATFLTWREARRNVVRKMVCHRDSQEAYRYWQVVKASALAFGNPRGESNHILCVAVERINVSLQNVGSRRVGLRVFLRRSVLCFGARFRSLTCELVAWKVFGTTTAEGGGGTHLDSLVLI